MKVLTGAVTRLILCNRSHGIVYITGAGAGGGTSMPTIKDVARAAGVSTASVSRVLTNHPATSPEMRERVQAAARDLNFRPNAVARSLRGTGTRTVGLVVSDLLNPYFTELARA